MGIARSLPITLLLLLLLLRGRRRRPIVSLQTRYLYRQVMRCGWPRGGDSLVRIALMRLRGIVGPLLPAQRVELTLILALILARLLLPLLALRCMARCRAVGSRWRSRAEPKVRRGQRVAEPVPEWLPAAPLPPACQGRPPGHVMLDLPLPSATLVLLLMLPCLHLLI